MRPSSQFQRRLILPPFLPSLLTPHSVNADEPNNLHLIVGVDDELLRKKPTYRRVGARRSDGWNIDRVASLSDNYCCVTQPWKLPTPTSYVIRTDIMPCIVKEKVRVMRKHCTLMLPFARNLLFGNKIARILEGK